MVENSRVRGTPYDSRVHTGAQEFKYSLRDIDYILLDRRRGSGGGCGRHHTEPTLGPCTGNTRPYTVNWRTDGRQTCCPK